MRIAANRVVRSKAPLRLGLAGGGTDLSPYCDTFGGAVLNATIGRYAMVSVRLTSDKTIRFGSNDLGSKAVYSIEEFAKAQTFDPAFALAAMAYRRISNDFLNGELLPVTIDTAINAPAGSGLGSSSALAVAIVEALAYSFDLPLGQYEVAHLAWEIERKDLQLAGGKQDHYAAAFGGINFIEFLPGERVIVNPLRLNSSSLLELEASLLVSYTGVSRQSADIIKDQVKSSREGASVALESLHLLKADAHEFKSALLRWDVVDLARILNRSWLHKKQTSSRISSEKIDEIYDLAMAAGALGGKISGAGGGGFMMFVVEPSKSVSVRQKLNDAGVASDFVTLHADGVQAWSSSTV